MEEFHQLINGSGYQSGMRQGYNPSRTCYDDSSEKKKRKPVMLIQSLDRSNPNPEIEQKIFLMSQRFRSRPSNMEIE